MGFSAFHRFNGGFRFSSRAPHGRRIYDALKASQGDTYEESFDGIQSARLYGAAMAMGAAQYQIDRAINNASPLTATELLPQIERDYQIVPSYLQTLQERRIIADARRKVTRGARREAIEDALRSLLGSQFVEYVTTDPTERAVWPATPGTVGSFKRAGAPKKAFALAHHVAILNEPVTVAITGFDGLDLPLPGETYTVEPDTRHPHCEKITIAAATSSSITATFARPHERGAVALSPHPVWISSQRYSRVVVTAAAARSQETRRKVNELMARMLRGISEWCIVSDEGTFRLGHATRAKLGSTRLP
jgi:hypothetical protein